uniref:Uncharacterized protein n=1 Tax=Euplotes harpa TaxID=151035 RepID=A0A7S3JGL5_9SPIT|mmetsp:Transcript_3459/g.4261  ORF Transcript_3459/g.4261 Transcript_3459/m.4261 type:complete len:105 (+) Transcript_3459:378-692(+)|eukprot:CAMPEP_0168328704 /NCGR_PEP_ID=MMETSP0213-20121227/6663_1 /TAXON_ID=151035 /ORGANISM="Euplotes harpa, Strain FSP1.4" /LENGTH=104 /DNA_ID=CAMNT_0008331873 /DNA_START=1415 /DNA_END=1729 /DNA_ORIENTATION=+
MSRLVLYNCELGLESECCFVSDDVELEFKMKSLHISNFAGDVQGLDEDTFRHIAEGIAASPLKDTLHEVVVGEEGRCIGKNKAQEMLEEVGLQMKARQSRCGPQ